MAPGLSSNWKQLQARIKAESTSSAPSPSIKRKTASSSSSSSSSDDDDDLPSKRKKQKSQQPKPASSTSKPSKSTKAAAAPKAAPAPASTAPATTSKMGNTQSSKIDATPKAGVSPSLALWAADNDISPEDLAEAYGLGLKSTALLHSAPSRPNEGLAPNVSLGKYVAIDCEMVGVGPSGHDSVLARVSVVDFHGRQVYDSFVRPKELVTDWRTHVSGVSPKHMATARPFEEVQAAVAELLRGRILVGHDVKHDLQVLMLDHAPKMVRDTARFAGFKKYGNGPKPALKVLAHEILGVEIQTGQHSSIEDARVAMLLFRKHKSGFDTEHANRYPDTVPVKVRGGPRTKAKKRKN
ncbi:ribonuclease H-like domain-containing protein [Podospora appendiculata]|uniref:RNA exonuclease 4 n=1 Tax=Podospora appendiculata TaxID=314037 RepID=A0AAE1CBB0_9PEZI|nr:ribonuclease H-like domain-containing protein [Podospora appendiculata]